MNHPVPAPPRFPFARTLLAALAATLGAIAAANAIIAARTPVLGPRLDGQFDRYPARYGDLAYVVGGSGSPVLLLHGLDAGRSMAEWRAVFEPLCDNHTVYALDFQGYGMSDTTPEGYNAADFAGQITNFIADVIGAPTAVLGAGASATPAILAARGSDLVSRLALICPSAPDAPSTDSRAESLLTRALSSGVLQTPITGTAVLNWWRSLKQLEKRARDHGFYNKDEAAREAKLWHITAHQKGADHAQKALLSDAFECDWRAAWEQTHTPALLVWGRNAMSQGFDSSPEWLTLRPDARLVVIEQAMLFPHLERPAEFCAQVLPWLSEEEGADG